MKTAAKIFEGLRVKKDQGAFGIYRVDKALLTPAGHSYRLPTERMAEAVVSEWKSQGDKIVPANMPMTQLAATTLDIVSKDRERIVRQIIAYASTDLLCHRADQPMALVERQQEVWQPLLDWCALEFKALLRVGTGIMPIDQDAGAITALHEAVTAFDDFTLAGLSHTVEVSGSLVLGLALAKHQRSAMEVFKAAELDASFQALVWGTDPATEARFNNARQDLENCERWFRLC